MLSLKQRPKKYAIIAVVLIVFVAGAFLVASLMLLPMPSQVEDNVGICVHTLSADDAQLVKDSGAGWIRIDISESLSGFNTSVRNAKAYNLSVLAVLDSWLFNQNTTFTLDDWRGNVTYYVSQYADYVDAWEIWNEPANPTYPLLNLNVTNEQSQQNMAKIVDFYYSMAQTAYPIIRQYDPTSKILLLGGLNLYSADAPNLTLDEEFASQLAAQNIQQYGDAVSIHAYTWGKPSLTFIKQSYSDSLAYYRGIFNNSLAVWVTETGKPLEENREAAQAQYLFDALTFFSGNDAKVFWYSLRDNSWETEQSNPQSFGLIGNDAVPRQAYRELQENLAK
jgi:hypothetical protein